MRKTSEKFAEKGKEKCLAGILAGELDIEERDMKPNTAVLFYGASTLRLYLSR